MRDWLGIDLSTGGADVFAWALLPVLVAIYWLYGRTRPSAPGWGGRVLVLLRGAVMALILLTLAELALGMWRKEVRRPVVAVLVDSSASMAIEEGGRSRLEAAQALLASDEGVRALAGAEAAYWALADGAVALAADTLGLLRPGGEATDLTAGLDAALKGTERAVLEGIVLVSDGAHNLGEDPVDWATKAGIPVFALGVGRRQNPADVQVASFTAAETGYVGRPLELGAVLRQTGFDGRRAQAVLWDGDVRIASRSVVFAAGSTEDRVVFETIPREAGPRAYRVRVEPLEGEFTGRNNEAVVAPVIRQDRRQVVLAAGVPSAEFAFLRRALEADSNATVHPRLARGAGELYRPLKPEDIERADVVLLVDPAPEWLGGALGELVAQAVAAGTGLLFIGGPQTFARWDSQAPVARILPWAAVGTAFVEQETPVRLGAEGGRHPTLRGLVADGDPFARLPPLPGYFPVQAVEGAMVLIETRAADARRPVVMVGGHGKGQVMAAASGGFWRLALLSRGIGKGAGTVERFWRDAVQWLGATEPVGRVRAETERRVYRSGEDVVFSAQVFDALLRPLAGGRVEVRIEGRESPLGLIDRGNGRYRQSAKRVPPGEYRFTAVAYGDEGEIGRRESGFIVEERPVETVDMRANPDLLEEIARVSGGAYRPADQWTELLERIPLQPRLLAEEKRWSLWGSDALLWILVALLCAEWALRKRYGML